MTSPDSGKDGAVVSAQLTAASILKKTLVAI